MSFKDIAAAVGRRVEAKLSDPVAPWFDHLDDVEAARLRVLDTRLHNNDRIRRDIQGERTRIMNRAIRRMRRTQGKN